MINRRLFAAKPSRLERCADVAFACALGIFAALALVHWLSA
jgi:hypothetical protein